MSALAAEAAIDGVDLLRGGAWDGVVQALLEECDTRVTPAAIRPKTSLRGELAMSSFQSIQAIMRLEELYEIVIDDGELAGLETVGDVVRLVGAKTAARGPAAP